MSTELAVIRQELLSPGFKSQVALALPKHIDPDRFMRIVVTSVNQNPGLLDCDRQSVLAACMTAAQLGLVTDGVLGEAYLVTRFANGRKVASLQIGYRGLVKLARQAGDIDTFEADVIYNTDNVTWTLGDLGRFAIERDWTREPGEVVGAYALARFKGGGVQRAIMRMDEIAKARDSSDGYKAFKAGKIKSTPWSTHPEEMAKKTAIRKLSKMLNLSTDRADTLRRAVAVDEAADYGTALPGTPLEEGLVDVSPPDAAGAAEAQGGDAAAKPKRGRPPGSTRLSALAGAATAAGGGAAEDAAGDEAGEAEAGLV